VKRLEGLRPSEGQGETTITTTAAAGKEAGKEAEGAVAEGKEGASSSLLNQEEAVDCHSSPRKRLCRLKTYAIYDKDFELFEHAKGEKSGEKPGGEKLSPGLKDNGWRRLKEKIFLGASSDVSVSVSDVAEVVTAIPSP